MDESKKKKIGRIILTVAGVLLAVVLVGALMGGLFLNSMLSRINRVEEEEPVLSPEQIESILGETDPAEENIETIPNPTMQPDEPNATEAAVTVPAATEPEETIPEEVPETQEPTEEPEVEARVINILLIGQDRRQGQERQRSDSMILCTVNTEKKTLVMTSFLRDTYVEFPMYGGFRYKSNRLNVAYILGGMGLLDATLDHNFGVKVDHNVEVDFSGFQDIINRVGGVEIKLTEKEAQWMVKQLERDEFKAGINVLDGEAALFYARIRKIDSDRERSNRQRKVLSALLQKVRNLSLPNLLFLVNDVLPMITTDMTNEEIMDYILEFFPILADIDVSTQHIPAEGTYKYETIEEMSVLLPNYKANRRILKETIG